MSKKATRRAAREAFPKAKTPPARRSRLDPPQHRSSSAKRKGGGSAYRPGVPKPPSIKRSVITGVIMAVLYFVVIQYAFKVGGTIGYNLLIAFIGFIIFTGAVYGTDHFRYRRYLKKKASSK
jgi:hypothetical protein